jgi:hypothetical protein
MLIIPNILRTIVIGLFLDTYLKIKYPIEYENLKIDLLYKSIYFYSRGQLFLNKMISFIAYLKNKYNEVKQIMSKQEMERDTQIIHFYDGVLLSRSYSKDSEISFKNTNDNSLFLFSQLDNNGINNFAVSRSQVFPIGCEVSNVKFILVELNVGDKSFKIDLKNDQENYYIVSNILDKDFFLYYMFNYSHNFDEKIIFSELASQIEDGVLKIIDENVKTLEVFFNKKGSITLEKNGYIINHLITNTNTLN